MKKIINGKTYDTEKAQRIGYSQYLYPSDSHYMREDLFRKKTGEFFLNGKGGSASKYAEAEGNNCWIGGEKIIPLTYEAAREWAEKNLGTEEYEKIFGEIKDDESKVIMTISISAASAERIRRAASVKGMAIGAYIESMIE